MGVSINKGDVVLRSGGSLTENRTRIRGGRIANLGTVTRDADSVIDDNSPGNCANVNSGTGC